MINYTPMRNVYPAMPGYTLGQIVTGMGTSFTPEQYGVRAGGSEVEDALAVGGQANPILGLLVFAGIVIALTLIARNVGGPEEFRSIKGTFYDAVWVSLVAIAGIPLWKFAFTKVKVPGVSAWVHSV